MTTGKGDQVCLGFLGVTPDIGAASRIVPDDVKEQLPAVSCQLSAFSADGWRLEAGGFQPNILQTVVSSSPHRRVSRPGLHAVCGNKRINGQASRLISTG
jgi:hypothetical protein